jgi:hypothetical protein
VKNEGGLVDGVVVVLPILQNPVIVGLGVATRFSLRLPQVSATEA